MRFAVSAACPWVKINQTTRRLNRPRAVASGMVSRVTTRPDPPTAGDERAILLGWLAFHRETLAMKCDGLSRQQLITMSIPPSDLSLLGLVRHLTEMERGYFVYGIGGGTFQLVYCTDENPDADIAGVADADPDADFATWQAECAHADRLIAVVPSLDDLGAAGNSLRWNLAKVLQEYARHNGHADLLRQRIDGVAGE